MSLFITSLNSGSNGNCYYIGNAEEAILVDAGISCRETERRMKRLGLKMDTVKAIFISHEHTDHISGVPVLAKKYRLPVYITGQTLHHSRSLQLEGIVFKPQEPVTIGQLQVTAFVKSPRRLRPHSFLVTGNGVTIGAIHRTSAGAATSWCIISGGAMPLSWKRITIRTCWRKDGIPFS